MIRQSRHCGPCPWACCLFRRRRRRGEQPPVVVDLPGMIAQMRQQVKQEMLGSYGLVENADGIFLFELAFADLLERVADGELGVFNFVDEFVFGDILQ